MRTEFRRADPKREVRGLMAFDRQVFPPADVFDAATWRECEAWWLLVDGAKAGCCAFRRHVDLAAHQLVDADDEVHCPGSLYIMSTAILPRFQRQGLGSLLKAWQIAYARRHGFHRIVTNTRKRNAAMIALNRKFGFRKLRTVPRYYEDPPDSTVVMVLELRREHP